MATRMTCVSAPHVEALNAVPIEFYGIKPIMDRWEEYIVHLMQGSVFEEEGQTASFWEMKRAELLKRLLTVMGTHLGYDFNQAQIDRVYFPNIHNWIQDDQCTINRGLAKLFKNEIALPVTVVDNVGATGADFASVNTEKSSTAGRRKRS